MDEVHSRAARLTRLYLNTEIDRPTKIYRKRRRKTAYLLRRLGQAS